MMKMKHFVPQIITGLWLAASAFGEPVKLTFVGEAPPPAQPLSIWFRAPATKFHESCPVGNGRLGGMLFGGVDREKIVLNEQTVWSGSVQDADREDAWKVLPEIRRLLLAGNNPEAQALLNRSFTCKGPGSSSGNAGDHGPFGCYQVLGLLTLNFDLESSKVRNYRREVDLDAATAHVSYSLDGVNYSRELFASAPDQALVLQLTADKSGQIRFKAALSREQRATVRPDGKDGFVLEGQLGNGKPDGKGVSFLGRLKVVADGGTVKAGADGVEVAGANSAMLYFTAGTDMFDPAFERTTARQLAAVAKKPLNKVRDAHLKEFRSFFRRVSIDLGCTESAKLPTPERLAAAEKTSDPQLAALYFQFGRYLLINSSRPDSPLPSNLQGIWAEETQTPWNGDFHLDINVQMNYWPAEVANLSDCHLPLLRYINTLVEPGRKTAKAYYNSDGWVAHVVSNPWGFTSPGEDASWGSTTSGSPWICEHLWTHYLYTHDKKFLAWAYPILKGAAQFGLDILIEEPTHRWLVTAPANSPENAFRMKDGRTANTCLGPTIDMQVYRELFSNMIAATRLLGRDEDFAGKLEAASARLAPHQIGKHGQLQEWLEDDDEPEPHHRHVSHLYGLYPGEQITAATPDLFNAARVSLERRGDGGTGWSLAWKVNFWARLGDGDHAHRVLLNLLHPAVGSGVNYGGSGAGSYPNLFCAHPPFQIDGNFGGCAGIAEMLLQSHAGEIHLLPALPKAWATGSVHGLRTRGGFEVDLEWKDGNPTRALIRSPLGGDCQVRWNEKVISLKTKRGKAYPLTF